MRIIVTTDAHANYPALKAVLDEVTRTGYDLFFHCGDAIGIGPQPRECLELLLNIPNVRLIRGNHDYWFAYGIPDWVEATEATHHRWVHDQLTPEQQCLVSRWPPQLDYTFAKVKDSFVHYPRHCPGTVMRT